LVDEVVEVELNTEILMYLLLVEVDEGETALEEIDEVEVELDDLLSAIDI
jgi:hypothetical protein